MRKIQAGDLLESIHAFAILNDDGTDEESDGGEIFFVLEHQQPVEFVPGEYRIIRQKTLKISSWNPDGVKFNFNKV